MPRTILLLRSPLVVLCFLLTAAPRPASAMWPNDPNTNVALSTAAGAQTNVVAVSDGAGGMIVAWQDTRSGLADIYAQRVLADGTIAPGWPAGGVALCTAAGSQTVPAIASDGAGGAIVTWQDSRGNVFAQRVLEDGTIAPGWPTNGASLVESGWSFSPVRPFILADGAGGAFVAWASSDFAPHAQRVTGAGTVAPGWPADALPLTTLPNGSNIVSLVSDGSGGVIVAFDDSRGGADPDIGIGAQRVTGAGAIAAGWPADGVTLCATAGFQIFAACVPDGQGGAIVAWWDHRVGPFPVGDVYAQHVTAEGAITTGWPALGVAVSVAADNQGPPRIAADGAGGAFIAWDDIRDPAPAESDVYALRLLPSGVAAGGWPADGLAVCAVVGAQTGVGVAADGAGGVLFTWSDGRSVVSGLDIYALRLTATGLVPTGWSAGGNAVSTALGAQSLPAIAGDGDLGALVAWQDARGTTTDVYAQRIERFGRLGNPEPTILDVRDVSNDQGGRVRIRWNASYLDVDPTFEIGQYWIWRQVPAAAAMRALEHGARLLIAGEALPAEAVAGRLYLAPTGVQQQYYWEFVASQPASGFAGYSYVAATTSDSTASSNPFTLFMVQARSATTVAFWNSAPDSGYSVDNLGPAPPAAFVVNFIPDGPAPGLAAQALGRAALHWSPSPEPDFLEYRIYRSDDPGFVPGPSTLIAVQPDTGYVDLDVPPRYYVVAAVDVHGNASFTAAQAPAGTTVDAPYPRPAMVLALGPIVPNPAHEVALVRFTLPRAGPVTLTVFDAAGRRVRELLRANLPAGEHTVPWRLGGDGGAPPPSGLYFVRLEAERLVLFRRFAAVR